MDLAPFKELVKQRCGLTFEGVAERPLSDGLRKRMAATGASNAGNYLARLASDDAEFHELVCLLTINETYFYREAEQLHFLVERLAPRMLAGKKDDAPLNILSAGCSTGEEPYSIAIALCEKYGEAASRLFSLAGGDIDKGALDKARIGRYHEFSFRGFSPVLRDRYFRQQGRQGWALKDEMRHQVSFHQLNLLAEHYPHGLHNFDVIFFRNVSIYFDEPTRRAIQRRLSSLLKDDGVLIVGSAETLANDLGVLHLTEEDELFYFTKHPASAAKKHGERPTSAKTPHRSPDEAQWNPGMHRSDLPGFHPQGVGRGCKAAEAATTTHHCASSGLRELESVPSHEYSARVKEPVQADAGAERALRLIQEKNYDAALAVLAPMLERRPGDVAARLLKAHILFNRKDYAAVDEIAKQVLQTEIWSVDAAVLLGLAAKWRELNEDAIKWFKQAVYACHECWPAHYYLGELYRAEQRMDLAARAYRVALQLLGAPAGAGDGLSIIQLGLPADQVRFLCEHQLARLDGVNKVIA
jgi:chemotaxis protein methyltransferase CheR